jgi:beta-N-acetylhexosaminidase
MSSIPQRLIIGIDQPYLDSPTQNLLKQYSPGGIILFDRNGNDPGQLIELIKSINHFCDDKPFIAIDFEGGRIRRMKALFSELKSPEEYKMQNLDLLGPDCSRVATEFQEYGINLNFAPVADLEYSPLNPALENRVYPGDSSEVAEYCRSFIKTFKAHNIMCCLKHFPGLGSSANDPHEEISVSCLPIDRIINNDLIPFKAGIDAGAAMIMTSHMMVSSIDEEISTFSKRTTDLARKTGFGGVLITDDMSMGAINRSNLPAQVLTALTSGHDMALICHDFKKYEESIIYLEKNIDLLIKKGHNESLTRIENVKKEHLKRIS